MRNDTLMRNNGAGGWNWRTKMKQQKHTIAKYQVSLVIEIEKLLYLVISYNFHCSNAPFSKLCLFSQTLFKSGLVGPTKTSTNMLTHSSQKY